jgi:hypothetical protein
MAKYRKKPIVIDAIQFNGENQDEIKALIGDNVFDYETYMIIRTLEGDMRAEINDWIIKGVGGEFYPCKPRIFEATYEPV